MSNGNTRPLPPYILALSIDDACKALSIKRTKIYELIKAGKLRSFSIGGRRVIQKSELEAFVQRCADGQE